MNERKKTLVQLVTFGIICFLLGVSFVYAQISQTHVISGGIYPGAYSYTVWTDEAGNYYAKNAYGVLSYTNTDESALLQDVIDTVNASGGGIIYLCAGTYTIESTVNLTDCRDLIIMGEGSGHWYNRASEYDVYSPTRIYGINGLSCIFNLYQCWNVEFRDLSIAGGLTNITAADIGILATTSYGVTISNCYFQNYVDTAISFVAQYVSTASDYSAGHIIRECVFSLTSPNENAISFQGTKFLNGTGYPCEDTQVLSNTFLSWDGAGNGIYFKEPLGDTISGVSGIDTMIISRNMFQHLDYAFYITGDDGSIISENNFEDNDYDIYMPDENRSMYVHILNNKQTNFADLNITSVDTFGGYAENNNGWLTRSFGYDYLTFTGGVSTAVAHGLYTTPIGVIVSVNDFSGQYVCTSRTWNATHFLVQMRSAYTNTSANGDWGISWIAWTTGGETS